MFTNLAPQSQPQDSQAAGRRTREKARTLATSGGPILPRPPGDWAKMTAEAGEEPRCFGIRRQRQKQCIQKAVPASVSRTGGFLLGIQVLFNFFKLFSQVWYVIVLSQILSNHIAKSKSKQELEHEAGQKSEDGAEGSCCSTGRSDLPPWANALYF